MVVSYRSQWVVIFAALFLMFSQNNAFSQARPLTDEDLDEIVAGNVLEDLSESLEEGLLPMSGDLFSLLSSDFLLSQGLIRVNAVQSDVSTQVNLLFLLNTDAGSVSQINTYTSR